MLIGREAERSAIRALVGLSTVPGRWRQLALMTVSSVVDAAGEAALRW